MVEQNLWEWPTSDQPKLEPRLWEEAQTWHSLDGQEPEAWQPRSSRKNQRWLEKHLNEKITNDILLHY